MLNSIATMRRRRQAVRELSRLTNRQLADLGIARTEIEAVVARAALRPPASSLAGDLLDAMAPSWAHHNRRAQAA